MVELVFIDYYDLILSLFAGGPFLYTSKRKPYGNGLILLTKRLPKFWSNMSQYW